MILTLDEIKAHVSDAAVPASLATGTVNGKRVVLGELLDGESMTVQLNEVGRKACTPKDEDEAEATDKAEKPKRKKGTPLSATVADVLGGDE